MKRLKYYVNTNGKWVRSIGGGIANFIVFTSPIAATRFFMSKPGRQIDVRGAMANRRRVSYCWKYWYCGKIVEQKPKFAKVRFNKFD